MRLFALFCFLILLYLPINADILSFSDKGVAFKSKDISFDFVNNNLSLSYKGFSYGDITRRGALRTFLNPHEYSDLRVKTMPYRMYNSTPGAIFSFSDFDVFLSFGRRMGSGFSFTRNDISIFYGYFSKGESDDRIQEEYALKTSYSLMLFGASYEHDIFSMIGLASVTDSGLISGLIGTRIDYQGYAMEIKYGDVFSLDERSGFYSFSINAKIDKQTFNALWSVRFGNNPIYSYEYKHKESEKNVTLSLGSVDITAKERYVFSRKGIAKLTNTISVKNDFLILSYDSKKGISSTLYLKEHSLSISRDLIEVRVRLFSINETYDLMVGISNKKGFEFEVTLNL